MQYMISPAQDLKDVAASNTVNDTNGPFRALIVGVAGDVKVTTLRGSDVVYPALVAGVIHPICCKRVWVTGTTATGIKGVPVNDHVVAPASIGS